MKKIGKFKEISEKYFKEIKKILIIDIVQIME